jgi:asparagine synthase (glutamine-hydrolysing)
VCGILGTIGSPCDHQSVVRGLDAIDHRGPDVRAVRTLQVGGGGCVLGHTRLRIIDLAPEADQPMPNEDDTVWVSFNGEIYNHPELRAELQRAGHRFRSRSDTECLVHLWEAVDGDPDQMLSRLRGMFAFALVDTGRGRVLLARDRLGIKPLYWTQRPGGLAFASEVRALVRAGAAAGEPDLRSTAGYLTRGVVPGPGTLVVGVEELPPGTYLLWEGGQIRRERWWAPTFEEDGAEECESEARLRTVLEDAVGRHLVADRPVGLFLSGGLDSGSVAALAAKHGKVSALTVMFPEDPGDEAEAAAARARALGVRADVVPVTGPEVARDLPLILGAMDQPTSDGVNTWVVCRAAKESGLVVALSGVGGDELFGGYSTFRTVPRVAAALWFLSVVPRPARALAAAAAAKRRPGGRAARILGALRATDGAYLAVRGIFAPAELPDGLISRSVAPLPVSADGLPAKDRVTALELGAYLGNQLLRDTDQMSMAHSLEVRVPLLDDDVVREALALPPGIRRAQGKAVLARAVGLDAQVVKRTFTLPFERWLRGPLSETVREGLLSEDLPFGDLLDLAWRRRLLQAFEEGRTHWSRPWAVAVLRLWPGANGFNWR